MRVKLSGGPRNGEVIICPDDALIIVLSADTLGKLQDHNRYNINHGVGTYQEKEDSPMDVASIHS